MTHPTPTMFHHMPGSPLLRIRISGRAAVALYQTLDAATTADECRSDGKHCHAPAHPSDYAALVAGELVVREARPGDARAIAEVSVASRRWSYRDLFAEADLEALSVEETTADFAEGLAELPPGAAVFVAERAGRVVGYAYVLPSPDADVPAGTSDLGSIYVTEGVQGRGWLKR
jgi:hypothetical protein